MKRAGMPKVLMIPYFCLFGSVGGYLLITALSPSVFTLLILPFAPLAGLSLIGSLIYLCRCRPFTGFHLGAVVCIGLVLGTVLLAFFSSTSPKAMCLVAEAAPPCGMANSWQALEDGS